MTETRSSSGGRRRTAPAPTRRANLPPRAPAGHPPRSVEAGLAHAVGLARPIGIAFVQAAPLPMRGADGAASRRPER